MKKYFTLLFCLLLSIPFVEAQRVMVVKKTNGIRRYTFSESDRLHLKLEDSGEVLRGSWQYLGENAIWLDGQEVNLNNIRWINVSEKESGVWVLRKGQDLLLLAGVGYFTISQLNTLIETGQPATGRPVWTSAGLVTGGMICAVLDRIIYRRKVPVENGRFSVNLLRYP